MSRPPFRDRMLFWLLCGLGMIDACAIFVPLMPANIIQDVAVQMEMSTQFDEPLFHYLIRSTSTLYALHGGLMLGLASDIGRYRPVIRLLGWLAVAHGIVMFLVDQSIGMPGWWTWTEGPAFAACGAAILALSRGPAPPAGLEDAGSRRL